MVSTSLDREARRATLLRFRQHDDKARPQNATARAPTLVVAADASRARLLIALPGEPGLREVDDLLNPEARLHEGDLVADGPGRRNNSSTSGGYSALGGGSMKRHRIEEFASLVCKRVERCLEDNLARRVYLVAQPEFLGLLRKQARPRLVRSFAGEVAKALTGAAPAEIRAVLPARL
ncbi:MAG TPA: host attachment protein [Nevskiaceae bacterium]|nr:host attachment protein [Nevskiaceae bacterium]